MDYLELIKSIDLEGLKADFADIRIEDSSLANVQFKDHELAEALKEDNLGVFIRIFAKGHWYSTSLYSIDKDAIMNAFHKLQDNVMSHTEDSKPFWELSKPHESSIMKFGDLRHKHSSKDIIDLIRPYDQIIKEHKNIRRPRTALRSDYSAVYYGNSRGVFTSYDHAMNLFYITFSITDNTKQTRNHFLKSDIHVSELRGLEKDIANEIESGISFLNAEAIKPGMYPVIMAPRAAGMFAHEIFGHLSEADFVNSNEEWNIGNSIAIPEVSIVDNGLLENSRGYTPFDDEGTPGSKTYLVKNGVINNHLHSLQSACTFNEEPTGNARASSAEYEPLIRMTTTYFDKGKASVTDLLSGIEEGVLVKNNKYGGGGFVLAPHRCYMIRKGEISEPVNVNLIQGDTLETMKNITGVSNDMELSSSGCAKYNHPIGVGVGGPHIRISQLELS